ncbi:MAG: substrate-binding domain-containing protein, partial [Phycisphaerae bacterium]
MADASRTRPCRVAIRISRDNAYGQGLLRGIAAFAQTQATWRFLDDPSHAIEAPDGLGRAQLDGVIAYSPIWAHLRAYQDLGIPMVNPTSRRLDRPCAKVGVDNVAMGTAGASHLLELGLTRLGFLMRRHTSSDRERAEAFGRAVEQAGAQRLDIPSVDKTPNPADALIERLDLHQGPVGLMCASDTLAAEVIAVLRSCQIDVPQHVAVLGCGNDELACAFSDPPCSSIDNNAFQIGLAAGKMLQELIDGQLTGFPEWQIQPGQVIQRESTMVLSIEDAEMARAVRFVRQNACKGIGVADVLAAVPISRRRLERGFVQSIGRSPGAEIRRIQMQRAMHLLGQSDLPIGQ